MSGDIYMGSWMTAVRDIGDYLFIGLIYGGPIYSVFVGLYLLIGSREDISLIKNWLIPFSLILVALLHWMLFFLDSKYFPRSTVQHLKEAWLWLHLSPAILFFSGLAFYCGPIKRLLLILPVAIFWCTSIGFGYLIIQGK